MTSPADELRAAVKVLRCEHDFQTEPRPGVIRYGACKHCGRPWEVGDRVSGEVAEPLAAWLESEAEHAEKGVVRDLPECPSCGDGCGGHDEQDFHDGTEDRGGCNRPLDGPADHRCDCFSLPLAVARAVKGGRQS